MSVLNPKLIPQAHYWWQVLPAIPNQNGQAYFALRRLWADHTMNTERRGRGFYWWGTEDNMTPVLFQNWAALEEPEAFASLLEACGHRTRGLRRVRWAYACEELITVGSFAGVEGRFLIPDIVLYFEDAIGPGLVAFEVKRPGVRPTQKDAAKLQAYTRLGSMRAIDRKTGCFLVGDTLVETTKALVSTGPTISWDDMRALQADAFRREFPDGAAWLHRIYALQGLGNNVAPAPAAGTQYASDEARAAINSKNLTGRQKRFLLGSETVEAFLDGKEVSPPLDWMSPELSRKDYSLGRFQSTASRRLCRWGGGWSAQQEL